MKQTAVEYLVKEIENTDWWLIRKKIPLLINQAKEMEKQQIVDAHGIKKDYSFSQIDPTTITGEQYYNDTFKNTNNDKRICAF